jgi:hypothetical protein
MAELERLGRSHSVLGGRESGSVAECARLAKARASETLHNATNEKA